MIALILVEIAVILFFASDVVLHNDFMEYWSAARLTLAGRNPYDPATMNALQAAAGWTGPAIMMWNPPWAIPIVLPFALLPFRAGSLAWPVFLFSTVAISAFVGWRVLARSPQSARAAIALSLLFPPSWFACMAGQISPLLLLGVTGFVWAVERKRDALAGVFLFLVLIKPHLLLLVLLAALVWCVRKRRSGVLLGAAAAAAVFGLSPLIWNPAIWDQYVSRVAETTPEHFVTMTLGAVLRAAWGWDRFWLQFAPTAVGVIWLLRYLWEHRAQHWDWARELPLLLLVSLLTSAYAWVHDVVVAVPVLIVGMAWLITLASTRLKSAFATLFVVASLAMVVSKFGGDAALAALWIVPALLVGFLFLRMYADRVSRGA